MRHPRSMLLLLALAFTACGYRLVAPPQGLGGDIEIRMLRNRTTEPGVERLIANALTEEFLRRGALRPGYSGDAGFVLSGQVRDVIVTHTALSSVALALEDQVDLVVDVAVVRTSDGETVWYRDRWAHAERFTVSADAQTYESNKEQALRRLSAKIAVRIHDELFQSF